MQMRIRRFVSLVTSASWVAITIVTPSVVRSRFKHCQDTPLIAGNGAKLKVNVLAVRFLGVASRLA